MKRILSIAVLVLSLTALAIGQVATAPAGSGTSGDPYQIATLNNLYWLTQNSSAFGNSFIQTADIDASSTSTWNSNAGWPPIGDETHPFTGTYDGQGKIISGLYINRIANQQGLFGATNGATIANLGLVNAYINANVFGGNSDGALVASNQATITNCFSTGTVVGEAAVGGLIGESYGYAVTGCYSTCSVTAYGSGGGLIGYSTSVVSNCYSRGDITHPSAGSFTDFGGFIGNHAAGAVSYCYSTGSVTYTGGTSPTDKGFTGLESGGTTVGDFWDTETSQQATSAGSATGNTTSLMTGLSTFLDAGWSGSTWFMDAGINGGYPYLAWQNPTGTPLPIQLASLTASPNGGSSVTLNWKTASETNNYGFYVERSASKSAGFAAVSGLIPGHGTSTTGFSYQFTDKSAIAGAAYYRLKQVDLDNSVHYSDAVMLATTDVAETAPVVFALSQNYPNPFNPSTEFRFTVAKMGLTTLVVYNAIGQEVARIFDGETESGKYYTARLDGASLASGVYFARLQSGSAIQMRKIVLMK